MRHNHGTAKALASAALLALGSAATFATQSSYVSPFSAPAISMAYAAGDGPTSKPAAKPADAPADEKAKADQPAPPAKADESSPGTTWMGTPSGRGQHKGLSRFWNIREAYSDVPAGTFQIINYGQWLSQKKGQSDFQIGQTFMYGVTDDFHVEIETTEPLGYGGYGAVELGLFLWQTFWRETDFLPAFGGGFSFRIPTGYGSSGFDGRITGALTKTICEGFRVHFDGYVEMGGGGRGDWEYRRDDIRGFRWGVGPGFDFQLFENAVFVLNYLHQSNLYYGERDQNIIELGLVHKLGKIGPFNNTVKFAGDIGLDGDDSTPTGGIKVLWAIDF